MNLRAIIIGGGPGGLTAAIALRRIGMKVVVYEQSCEIRPAGSGITLWPNALQALEYIGLIEPLQAISLSSGGIAMYSWKGDCLFEMPSASLKSSFGVSGIAVHRAELLSLLLELLGRKTVTLGAKCMDVRQEGTKVTAEFECGLQATGDLLIGADGLHSVVRSHLFTNQKNSNQKSRDAGYRYAGYTVWRGVTHFDLPSTIGSTSLGRGAQFGLFPMTQQRVYWFAAANAPEGAVDWAIGRKRELLERFRQWHDPIQAVIEATEESAILRNDIYDRDPLDSWNRGHVTLLGDAAHASTPNLGQGACQAIEDGVVLAACLQQNSEISAALKAYEAKRLARANAMTLQSRQIAQVGCWENSIACWFRNLLIKHTPQSARSKQLQDMFQFQL